MCITVLFVFCAKLFSFLAELEKFQLSELFRSFSFLYYFHTADGSVFGINYGKEQMFSVDLLFGWFILYQDYSKSWRPIFIMGRLCMTQTWTESIRFWWWSAFRYKLFSLSVALWGSNCIVKHPAFSGDRLLVKNKFTLLLYSLTLISVSLMCRGSMHVTLQTETFVVIGMYSNECPSSYICDMIIFGSWFSLFSIAVQSIAWKDTYPQNDVLYVEWDIKLCSLTHWLKVEKFIGCLVLILFVSVTLTDLRLRSSLVALFVSVTWRCWLVLFPRIICCYRQPPTTKPWGRWCLSWCQLLAIMVSSHFTHTFVTKLMSISYRCL